MKKLYTFLVVALCALTVNAQEFDQVIRAYLNNNRVPLGLENNDVQDFVTRSQAYSESMSVYNVYVDQRYQGIPVFNSTSSFAISEGNVRHAAMSFEASLENRVNATSPSIEARTAIGQAARFLGLDSPRDLQLIEGEGQELLFNNGGISLNDIPVRLVLQPVLETGELRLAWDLSIYLLDASHYYSVRIDAINGELIGQNDWVVECQFDNTPHAHQVVENAAASVLFQAELPAVGQHAYRVFPAPVESPNHGGDELVPDPSEATASPFGWHDTNGAAGAEFTITRGNNVWAQEDRNGNNGVGFSPDGGPELNFDFPFNFNTDPVNMQEAAITNLFYWNNIIHDVMYQYGFDEASGNFQENNYGNGANGSDSVNADAQDGSGTNNATFGTPPDGQNPRMSMFLWSPSGPPGEPLTINNGPLAGVYEGIAAQFGSPLPSDPLTGDLVLVLDNNAGGGADENDACEPITNGGAINGNIAVIRRGSCEFGSKVLDAEQAGAIAVIMVNNVGGDPIAMGAGAEGGSVTIPSIMVNNIDGEAIIAELEGGGNINASLGESGPYAIDGDVDNGIIVHEYGHGISNRLAGGRLNTGCLSNEEQMGEGWSDYYALLFTMEPGDQAEDIRGIGTYAIGQPTNGGGIRPRPYSTDFSINEMTYDWTNRSNISRPHGIGSVWATMLWDLTWALIDEYGWDPDLYNGTGGNNIAMQLVTDGLRLQNCSPGFVNGRDAILEADELAFGGANRCLIWEVFANRGLGESASQGSAFNRFDQVESFDVPSDCALNIDDRGAASNFVVYPNPADGIVNIRALIDATDATISIVDLNGRIVLSTSVDLSTEASIETSGLAIGLYVMQIQTGTINQTIKLVIE